MANTLLCLSAVVLLLVGLWPRNKYQQWTWKRWFYRNIYLRTPHWHKVRAEAWDRANYTCEAFGCEFTGLLECHHLTYKNLWHEKPSDVVMLCRKHHDIVESGHNVVLKGGWVAYGKTAKHGL